MVRLKRLLALATSIAPIYATQPNLGWRAEIVTGHVTLNTDNVGGEQRLYVSAPVNITRLQATAASITLNLYTSPYFGANQSSPQAQSWSPSLVSSTEVQPPSQSHEGYLQSVDFDISAESWQNLLVSVGIQDTQSGPLTTEWTGAVIAYNATSETWRAWNPGKYAHSVNTAVTRTINNLKPKGKDEGEDKTPEEPEKGYQRVDNVAPKVPPPTTYYTSEQPTITHSEVYTVPSDTQSFDYGTYTTQPGDGSHETISGCSCDPYTVWSTITVYPDDPLPSYPPEEKRHEKREKDFTPAFVDAKITFKDRDAVDRPLRFIRIRAVAALFEGDTYIGEWQSIETLNEEGQALFQFGVSSGQRIVVHTLYAKLQGEHYLIGTRATEADEFQVAEIALDITLNPWMVSAGDTIFIGTGYPLSENNKALWVADAYHTITSFFSTKIATREGEMERVHVWYPSPVTGGFFAVTGSVPYINLPGVHAQNPSVMAHEYGHFAHYLARRKEFFDGGGVHRFCFNANDVKISTSFSEGYATALGLLAIDDTYLAGDSYMVYEDRNVVGSPFRVSLEDFDCFERNMTSQEGRIAAALIDLVDRKLDVFHAETDNFGFIAPDFDPQLLNWCFEPRFVFWRNMYDNPATIVEYWRKFQAVLTTQSEDIAWAVLQYNFADFPAKE
ncbi:hypothetical protein B0T10DRAFT_606720 [Thelonectria olida]|uniref:Peptidase M60 domain-containing protein n=1 Tax=Thelonectria olida TaxID=1576542 RepID=A0A9P8W3N1_9HYPO|nr:hypothetical protein B0T10DRAFT_606720 [Thelonectria olida]